MASNEANIGSHSSCVYVSYSWTAENKAPVVDELAEACKAGKLDLRRDRERLKHGDLIRNFMDEIGSAGSIVPVFSREYFESEYCMYELLQAWKAGDFHQRIHPVVLGDIRLDDVQTQLRYLDYWEKKTRELQAELKTRDPANAIPLLQRNIVYADIYRHINELMAFVSNMNILPLETLRREQFQPLLDRIKPAFPTGTRGRPACRIPRFDTRFNGTSPTFSMAGPAYARRWRRVRRRPWV